MSGRAWVAAVVLTAIGTVFMPGSAVASPDAYELDAGHVTRFRLNGTAGFRVGFSSNDRGNARVKTSREGVTTEYTTRGRRTAPFGIAAKFADLGLVNVKFKPNGRMHRLPQFAGCDGSGPVVREGFVHGRIRFVAEQGFTRVRAHRVKAEVVSWDRQRCRYRERGSALQEKERAASFSAFSPFIAFEVSRFADWARPASARVAFTAFTGDGRGHVRIFRSAVAKSGPASFQRPGGEAAPEHFVLTPPPPFIGTGTFLRTPESTFSWEGSLSVEFPGAKPMLLTGPGFATSYCTLSACIDQASEEDYP